MFPKCLFVCFYEMLLLLLDFDKDHNTIALTHLICSVTHFLIVM